MSCSSVRSSVRPFVLAFVCSVVRSFARLNEQKRGGHRANVPSSRGCLPQSTNWPTDTPPTKPGLNRLQNREHSRRVLLMQEPGASERDCMFFLFSQSCLCTTGTCFTPPVERRSLARQAKQRHRMTRGNQRELARAKAQKKRAEDAKRNSKKEGSTLTRNFKYAVW